MKVKILRVSGNPVDPELNEQKEKQFKDGFDAIVERHGKAGPDTNRALEELDAELLEEYNDLTVATVEMPKTKKAWVELLSKYGNIMVTTCIEDGEHAKSGDLLLVINDMPF